MSGADGLKDVIVFLIAAGVVVPFFHRARIGAVLGFLVIGMAVGPYGLGQFAGTNRWIEFITIGDPSRVEPFAELGVIFLLFILGLELSVGRMWRLRRFVFGVGTTQIAASALAIGGVLWLAGASGAAAGVIGLCLALSSTAIVMQLLVEQHRAATQVGRVALSVLLFQDLMVAPILVVTGVLGGATTDGLARALALAVVQALAAVVLILIAGRYVLRPLLRFAAQTGSRDLIMAITLLIVVGASLSTGAAGLSAALGAFLAGLLLSESEYRHQIEVDLDPFKGLLLGLFFMTVGMTIDLRAVLAEAGLILACVIGLVTLKSGVLYAAARAFGVKRAVAAEVALLLPQAGEFAFVVIALARGYRIISATFATSAIAVVGLSMMVTPLLAMLARRAGQDIDGREHAAMSDMALEHLEDHVIIGGFGRVGQTIARLLEMENVPFVALDASAAVVTAQRKAGRMVYFGDASRAELLERAGARQARAFIVTLDGPQAAERMVQSIMRLRADARIFARAKDPDHAARLCQLGAIDVIPEATEASLQLGGRALAALGLPEEAVAKRLITMREDMRQQLDRPAP